MGKSLPEIVVLILEINKTVIVASRWFLYYITYSHNTYATAIRYMVNFLTSKSSNSGTASAFSESQGKANNLIFTRLILAFT